MFEFYQGEVNKITEDEVIDYGLTALSNGYAWIHDNQLWERNENGVELLELPVNPLYLNNVKILSNGSDSVVVWEQSEEFASDLYAIYYDNDDRSWGEPVRLTEDSKKIRESSGYLADDGTVRLAFGQAEIDENSEEIYGKCNLMLSNITGKNDIEVTNAGCSYIEYMPNEETTIWATVKNNSSDKVSEFNINIVSDGKIIAEQSIDTEIISGGSADIEVPYILPSDLSHKAYTITVTPIDITDDDLSNNSSSFEIGFADVKADAVKKNNTITATVSNIGCLSAENVVCDLLSADGEVIDTRTIGSINAGMEQSIQFEFNGADNVSVSVSTDSEENLYSNNTVAIITSESISKNKVYIILGEYEITDNKLSVNATVSNETEADKNITVIAASYKNGVLSKVMTKPITLTSGSTQVIPYDFGTSDADSVKIFIWDSLNRMKPYDDGVALKVENNQRSDIDD